ncbi:MAG: GAF domain-containing protein [Planctomycetota bacterium]|nr:MAG: GAF domain-containing protein [Planctomycetota bacterium]
MSEAGGRSIVDFMTDGSLAALCESASKLLGRRIELRDAQGRVVERAAGATPPWVVREDGEAQAAVATAKTVERRFPIRVGRRVVGALTLQEEQEGADGATRWRSDETGRFLELLARTVGEICERQAQLAGKVRELRALHALSGLLVKERSLESTLEAALALAVETLGADAGSVRVLDEEQRALQLRASVGLSDNYLHKAGALRADQSWAKVVEMQEAQAHTDLRTAAEALHPQAVAEEGLAGALSAPLRFRGRTIGLLRLYWRTPLEEGVSRAERALAQAIAEQMAAAVENARLLEAERRARQVDRQLRLAREVQSRMLPRRAPEARELDVAWRWEPSLELGGDFLDVFEAAEGVGLALGDVVGKGAPAALLAASVRATLRAHARDEAPLEEVVARTNQALCRDTRVEEFATLFFGMIDPASRRLAYCSAGHEPALVIRAPGHRPPCRADVDELRTGGMVLGVDPSQRYQQGEFSLQRGDALLVFSDGLTEALDFQGRTFGRGRALEAALALLTQEPQASAQRLADHLLWEMRRFVGLKRQSDDATILVVRVRDAAGDG